MALSGSLDAEVSGKLLGATTGKKGCRGEEAFP
jgi:hypothetical protein